MTDQPETMETRPGLIGRLSMGCGEPLTARLGPDMDRPLPRTRPIPCVLRRPGPASPPRPRIR